MQEIRILQILIVFLSLTPLIQRFIKDLRNIEGVAYFPPFALISAIALFPAYGFRPESIPLLTIVIILNIRNFPALLSLIRREGYNPLTYYETKFTLLAITLLLASGATAVYFAPLYDTALTKEGITTVNVRDETRGKDIYLRIYDKGGRRNKPVLFIVPPIIGSVTAVDMLCEELERQGFVVIAYSRRRLDSPAVGENNRKYGETFGTTPRFLSAVVNGKSWAGANTHGRNFETERTDDISFLIPYIRDTLNLGYADKSTLFLAGYDAGASALIFLGSSYEFVSANPQIKGIIAVDPPFWSSYESERRFPGDLPENTAEWVRDIWFNAVNFFINIPPKRIAGAETPPQPRIPTIFLTSDRLRDREYRERNNTPLDTLLKSRAQTILATAGGAGDLTYSDYPIKYPIYTFFLRGREEKIWRGREITEGSASIISKFALNLGARYLTPDRNLLEKVDFEQGEGWILPFNEYIISP